MSVWGGLTIAEKRREAKGKGRKERYIHLNAEFQQIARKDRKAKKYRKNHRLGKMRDLFKKFRDTKGTFHAKMGSIKDRNRMELTESENIKKRRQEYTEEMYKKRSSWPRYSWWYDHSPRARHPGMWSQVGLRKHHYSGGGDGIPVELFQILKDDAVKELHLICQHIWKTQQWPWDWKRSVFIPIPKKGNAKECSATTHLHSSHTLVK